MKNTYCHLLAKTTLVLAAAIAITVPARAETLSPQAEMSRAVNVVCPQLRSLSGQGRLNAAEDDLFFRCREVVGPISTLNTSQVGVLSQMTSDESDAMGTSSVEIGQLQNNTIARRLKALRAGGSVGLASSYPLREQQPLYFAGPVTSLGTESEPKSATAGGRLGVFVNGVTGAGDKDASSLEPGFDFSNNGLTAGTDFRFSQSLVLGAALGYGRTEVDFDRSAGDMDVDAYGLSLYGTFYTGNLYLDAIGSYVRKDYDLSRRLDYAVARAKADPAASRGAVSVHQSFEAETEADEYYLSMGSGYNHALGALTIGPYVRLNYLDASINGYREKLSRPNSDPGFGLALSVEEQDVNSLTSDVGAQISYAISTGFGVLTPHLWFEWEHEFENDTQAIKAGFVNGTSALGNVINIPSDDPDADYFNVGAGISAVFPRGISAVLNYATVLDMEDVTNHQFTLGMRFEL